MAVHSPPSPLRPPSPRSQEKPASQWRSAIDPATNRTYYYDTVTRTTQWRKPLDLCSPSERDSIKKKEDKMKDFFSQMEANVLRNIEKGDVTGSLVDEETRKRRSSETGHHESNDKFIVEDGEVVSSSFNRTSDDMPPVTRVVRTISSMDDLTLTELNRSKSSSSGGLGKSLDDSAAPKQIRDLSASASGIRQMNSLRSFTSAGATGAPGFNRESSTESVDSIDEAYVRNLNGLSLQDGGLTPFAPPTTFQPPGALAEAPAGMEPPRLQHRNSGSTLFVGSTMSAPDKDGMISCVCGLFRAHMVQYAKEEAKGLTSGGFEGVFAEYDVFNDPPYAKDMKSIDESSEEKAGDVKDPVAEIMNRVPKLSEVTKFFRDLFRKSQMESDCIIMSLIYVERLLKQTKGGIRLTYKNWNSIIFSSMVMSSKVWDDLSMWNADFSQVCSSFTLQRINELELAMLNALRYDVKVKASEYAKYYFLLRSMLMKSGLGGDHVER
ncbi:hypothetical protein TL16_g01694 [Triparma laevis f. inornata]|uniref:WW domain-containing protein n=1 Tax=Triparma laevis f. inornata TaxID=1714386 RepID=A0A9W6ZHG5_9STRA|nr:hypothetical protein TL16_g01694 [Triparma laevis f. inornata]